MTDIWQNLAGQETAKRAIEIAMVGGLAITFIPVEGAGRKLAACASRRRLVIVVGKGVQLLGVVVFFRGRAG